MPQWTEQRQEVTVYHASPPPLSQLGSRDQSDSDISLLPQKAFLKYLGWMSLILKVSFLTVM